MQDSSVKDINTNDLDVILERIVAQANMENIRITHHAQQEMDEEDIRLDEVLEAISNGRILENYSEHLRGACCLVNGSTKDNRPLHIVCTTEQPVLIIITVYSPKQPKWITPTRRRK
ncbi:DUF4258 domain-containing protein [bacterium]|nr:DUF4258 domain-containing protein [bacterium]